MDSPLDGFLDVLDVARSWTVIHLDVVTHKSNRGKKRVQYNSPVPTSYARIRTPLSTTQRGRRDSLKIIQLRGILPPVFLLGSAVIHVLHTLFATTSHFPLVTSTLPPHAHVNQVWRHSHGWIRREKTGILLKGGKNCCGSTINGKQLPTQRTLRTQAVVC